MKKRILFVIPSFEIGGTTVSVKNLILLLDKCKYEVEVLPMADTGKLRYLYDDIKQIPTSFLLRTLTVESWRNQKSVLGKFIGGLIRFMAHIGWIKCLLLKLSARLVVDHHRYDTLVACQEGICTHFVSQIKGKNKVAWVRCDYTRYAKEIGYNEKEIYGSFKNIVCVSELTKQKFCQIHPYFADKCWAINNPQSVQFILDQANRKETDDRFKTDLFTIISIGRFCLIKRFERIPDIALYLKNKGLKFRWYVIGGGSDDVENLVREKIKQYDVEDCVVLLGVKSNPHYYIKQSDLLVVLSASEACPRVVNEAKILHVPVVCTDFETANEFITNGKDGVIATIDSIANSIEDIMRNTNKYLEIKNTIKLFSFDNEELLKKVSEVFE